MKKKSPIKHYTENENRDLEFREYLCPVCFGKIKEGKYNFTCKCGYVWEKEMIQQELFA